MKFLLSNLILIIGFSSSGIIGWYLDEKLNFEGKSIYWGLGIMTGYIIGLICGSILLKQKY